MFDGLYLPPKPAIIQRAEPWEIRAHADLVRLGAPRHVRRAIVTELKRLQGVSRVTRPILKATVEDMERFGKLAPFALAGMILNPYSFGAAAPSISYTDVATDTTTNNATKTFATRNFGTAATGRLVVVAVSSGPAGAFGTIDSVAIGGTNGTAVMTAIGSTNEQVGMYQRVVDDNSNTDVTITRSNAGLTWAIAIWAIYDLQSTTATDAPAGSQATPGSIGSFDINANGVAIAYASARSNNDPTWTWTGWSGITTEDFDSSIGTGNMVHSGTHTFSASAQTGLTITSTASNTTAPFRPYLLAASWA